MNSVLSYSSSLFSSTQPFIGVTNLWNYFLLSFSNKIIRNTLNNCFIKKSCIKYKRYSIIKRVLSMCHLFPSQTNQHHLYLFVMLCFRFCFPKTEVKILWMHWKLSLFSHSKAERGDLQLFGNYLRTLEYFYKNVSV